MDLSLDVYTYYLPSLRSACLWSCCRGSPPPEPHLRLPPQVKIHHCRNLRLLRVTQGYPEQSFMWNPPLIILLAFLWLSENSKPRVFFTHYLSILKCKHCSLFTIYVGIFKHIQSFKYPGYTLEFEIHQGFAVNGAKTWQLLRVTLGYSELITLMLLENKNNLPKIP